MSWAYRRIHATTASESPDRREGRGTECGVPGDKRQVQVLRCCRNDAVGHVGDNVPWNALHGSCDAKVKRGQYQSAIHIRQELMKTVKSCLWEPPFLNQVDDLH